MTSDSDQMQTDRQAGEWHGPELDALGWTAALHTAAQDVLKAAAPDVQPDLLPARVAGVGRGSFRLWTAQGEEGALLAGVMRQDPDSQPVMGDWVVAQRLLDSPDLRVTAVLPRHTTFARAVHGGLSRQVITANVDTVLIVTAPDADFDLPRLGRYVAAVHASGAQPALLLNKTDLTRDPQPFLAQLRSLAPGVSVYALNARTGEGLGDVRGALRPGVTAALIGSSGVGKSTLTNALLGRDAAQTGAVMPDGLGRHTTTARTLYRVPGGGLLVDNPGLRDIAVWDPEGVATELDVIEQIAADCRYRKCTHTGEPGCAVRRAVQRGQISAGQLEAYHALKGTAAPTRRNSRPPRR
ncbi:ribosome small subunit-dependent GTPase A [Deinococcus sp.]|uniref:ribosome small subunit-dependent GTPase A n=1 Tax=Deinococcus sp. TaxID=47478 RepID=UPI0025BCCF31|nr:ribosome small subunit-dependent GTPase A [Deinococcus sp.]